LGLHREIVDLDEFARLAIDRKLGRWSRSQFLVGVQIFEPENDVVGREGLSVRPFHALAQEPRRRLATVLELPVAGDGRYDLQASVINKQELIGGHDAVHVFPVRRPRGRSPHGAAVLADLMQWLEDHRFLGQALLNRRQLAALDELGQHRCFVERFGHLGGVGNDGCTFELANQLAEIGLCRGSRLGRRGGGRLSSGGCRLSRRGRFGCLGRRRRSSRLALRGRRRRWRGSACGEHRGDTRTQTRGEQRTARNDDSPSE